MKVCSFLDFEPAFKDTGIGNGVRLHRRALEVAGVKWTSDPNDDYDILHVHTFGPLSMAAALRAKIRGVPVVSTAHSAPEDYANSFWFSNLTLPVFKKLALTIYKISDAVVCPSQYTKDLLKGYGVKSILTVIYHPIDFKGFRAKLRGGTKLRKKYGLRGTVVFGVGYVFPKRKGIDDFVRVARAFPDTDFIWFGKIFKGALKPQGLGIIKNAPPNARFTGYVDDIGAAFDAGDIFLFPTRSEMFGLVLLEALAAGKPCITSDNPGLGWARDGADCLKGHDAKDYAALLRELLGNPSLRKRFSTNAVKKARAHDYKIIGKQYKKLYENLME